MAEGRPQLRLLSADQLDKIEETAYRLLDEVGVALDLLRAREVLHDLGCRVENARVHIPPNVVCWSLDHLTPAWTYRSPDGSQEIALGNEGFRTHPSAGIPFILDSKTGKRRSALLHDLADVTRLLDALSNVDVVIPLVSPQDVPGELVSVASFASVLRNTRKPVGALPTKPADVRYIVALAEVCRGGEESFHKFPNVSIVGGPISPLRFTEQDAGVIMAIAESGATFDSMAAPCLGATSPITVAGALAQQHAEVLAGFAIAAATRPGTPVRYGARISPIDLRTATSTWGGPEVGISGACAVQLAHRLGLPCNCYGLSTSSSKLDPQFAYEKLANAMVPALAGVDVLSGVGSMEDLMTASLEGAVIDDEMIGLLKHIIAGCKLDESTLAFDLMREVIASGDTFLGHSHTVVQMCRGEIWMPSVGERETGTTEDDRAGVIARAGKRAREILETHEAQLLPEEVNLQLDEIMKQAAQELVGT